MGIRTDATPRMIRTEKDKLPGPGSVSPKGSMANGGKPSADIPNMHGERCGTATGTIGTNHK